VKLSVDLRAADDTVLSAMDAALKDAVLRLASAGKVAVTVEQVVYFPPQPFTPGLVSAVRDAAQAQGLTWMNVISGAGEVHRIVARA
ncbi:Zn-dependent hydrolase, partial [Xylella fastidiosa subsp. multiplex]|uniref:hypothetical protein n=1 Tax=Xylella fastidiosa TaxID=2371 RepID=UPI00139FB130